MLLRTLVVAGMAATCSGCVGVIVEVPETEAIWQPVPLRAERFFGSAADRWACQQAPGRHAPLTKKEFLAAWGEPREKRANPLGETWIYAESGRWCGLVVFVLLPIPALLPVCETYDHVEFEGEQAMRSTSHRLIASGGGVAAAPPGGGAFSFRSGKVTENRSWIRRSGPPEQLACALPQAKSPASARSGPAPGPAPDRVNCVVAGKRQWTDRSNCD